MISDIEKTAGDQTHYIDLRPLPYKVIELLSRLDVPLRLVAHLRAVHDVAFQLTKHIAKTWPRSEFDAQAVLFGAAIHDIGKSLHPNELSEVGKHHEPAGYQLLLDNGIDERFSRYARTHSKWAQDDATIEDHLVALADKVWKGKREQSLESLVVKRLAQQSGTVEWEVFMTLDDILTSIASQADERLAFQNQFPTA